MEVRSYAQKKRNRARQCSTPGCSHSANCDVVLLGAYFVGVCTKCRKTWEETWDRALHGWPDEDRVAA